MAEQRINGLAIGRDMQDATAKLNCEVYPFQEICFLVKIKKEMLLNLVEMSILLLYQ